MSGVLGGTMPRVLTAIAALMLLAIPAVACASPSRIVLVPSTDALPAWWVRGDLENYLRVSDRRATEGALAPQGGRDRGTTIIGATLGLPVFKLKGEVGVDYTAAGPEVMERNPVSFNAKLVVPELLFGKYSPAFALGVWNYCPEAEDENSNIAYGLVGYTVPLLGKLALGGYHGSETALGRGGVKYGVLASLDRLVSERIWLGVDYIGGSNARSSVNAALSYAFSKRASLLVGYDLHTERRFSGADTVLLRASFRFL